MWRNIAENAAILGSQAEHAPANELRQTCSMTITK
jgi:hypothetical protein